MSDVLVRRLEPNLAVRTGRGRCSLGSDYNNPYQSIGDLSA